MKTNLRIAHSVLSVLLFLTTGSVALAAPELKLRFECDSEDDGILSETVRADSIGDGLMIGKMSVSGIRLQANLGAEIVRGGILLGDDPEFLLFPRVDSLTGGAPLAAMRIRNVTLRFGQTFRFSLMTLGHTDPEGIVCLITPIID